MINDKLHTKEALNLFARTVIRKARANKLSTVGQSLEHKVTPHPNSFHLSFKALPYLDYVDRGVGGSKSSFVGLGREFKGERIPRFKDKHPPTKDILAWVRKKRMRLRDKESGEFVKGSQKSLAFLIGRSIFERGLRPSLFFTKPFKEEFKNLPPKLVEAYSLDVEDFIDSTFRDHLK